MILVLQLPLPSPLVENEDVVGAAPTGDGPTTSERLTISLPTKVPLMLEVWRYLNLYVPILCWEMICVLTFMEIPKKCLNWDW